MGRKPHISQVISNIAKDIVKTANDAHELRKAQAILLPALFSLDLVATGIVIGRSKASVCRLQSEFRADCAGTHIAPKKRGGRRRQNMSFEQEAQLLKPFFQKARKGKPFVVADIPGLIEGAHKGVGLGTHFLRHIERTRVLVHLIDASTLDPQSPITDYETINQELAKYSPQLMEKPQIVVLNKMDLPGTKEACRAFRSAAKDQEVYTISALVRKGLDKLTAIMIQYLERISN